MKTFLIIISIFFSLLIKAEEITDFSPPIWNYGTANGANATGSGTISGIPFTITFHLNNGTKLFTEPPFTKTNQHTSNALIGHGGPDGSLLLGGVDEGLTINFASPVTVTLGLSHVNISSDGWDFLTPPDEIVSLHQEHEVIGTGTIDGLRQNSALGNVSTDTKNTSYFKWNSVQTINIQTVGAASTTLALSSMNVIFTPTSVPSLNTWGIFSLVTALSLFGLRRTYFKT